MKPQDNAPPASVWPPPPSVGYSSVVEDDPDAQAKLRKRAGRRHVWKGVGLSLGIVFVPFLYLWLKSQFSGVVSPNPDGMVCAAAILTCTLSAFYQAVRALLYWRAGEGFRVLALAVAMLFISAAFLFPVFARHTLVRGCVQTGSARIASTNARTAARRVWVFLTSRPVGRRKESAG